MPHLLSLGRILQARGIFEAALSAKEKGWISVPNIMIPLVSCAKEFESQAHVIRATAATVFAEKGDSVDYKVGVSAFVCARACAHVRMHGHDAWRLLLAPTLINA